jgi:hypothetical protein
MLSNYYPYTFNFDFFDQNQNSESLLIEQMNSTPSGSIIICYCYEWLETTSVCRFISNVKKNIDRTIIWILTDSFYTKDEKQQIHSIEQNINFIEFDLLLLHFELDLYKTSMLNDSWNPTTGKFLFLTGKPDRLNRIRLLHKFYEKKLLKSCIWSFFCDDTLEKRCHQYLPELTEHQYKEFIAAVRSNPDDIDVKYQSAGTCHYDGYPFDTSLFSDSSFRVIAETMMMNKPIISEKTWITIANRLPFIIAGYANTSDILKKEGFRTFEEYLPIKNYDSIIEDEERLDSIVLNTEHWLENLQLYKDDIKKDIEFNYQLLSKKIEESAKKFDKIYARLEKSGFEKFRILPMPIQRSRWINFYYGIKDRAWPDCWSEKDFQNLPKHVQKEIIEVFGFEYDHSRHSLK